MNVQPADAEGYSESYIHCKDELAPLWIQEGQ